MVLATLYLYKVIGLTYHDGPSKSRSADQMYVKQRQTAVTAYLKSKWLLLFAFAQQGAMTHAFILCDVYEMKHAKTESPLLVFKGKTEIQRSSFYVSLMLCHRRLRWSSIKSTVS